MKRPALKWIFDKYLVASCFWNITIVRTGYYLVLQQNINASE